MYEAYFGLTERPFSIAPDPRYLYLSPRHREALAHLLYGITERGGFVQLTGEVGTGKTTITRALLEQLPADVDVALILNPNVTVREFLVAICEELKVELPKRAHSAQALVDSLMHYLLEAYARGRHTVVLVDEAQNLSGLVLEQVRLLTNLETTKEKLLQIILVGQPELRDLLKRAELRQVAQRITARYHLFPLSVKETREYIQHRLHIAGCNRPLFTAAAVWAIHRMSGGIPRLINVICDRALLGAYAGRQHQAGLKTVLTAAREVAGAEGRGWGRWIIGGLAAGVLAVAGLAFALPPLIDRLAAPEPAAVAEAPVSLEGRLQQAAATDARAAFGRLFQLWGAQLPDDPRRTPCELAQDQGLRCYYEHGAWEALQARNLAAVIELSDRTGRRHQVLLTGIADGQATLELDGQRLTFPIAEVANLWTRDSVALWRPPAGVHRGIGPDSENAALAWLVGRLDRVERRLTPTVVTTFTKELEERVKAFQRANALTVDGIVGEGTLLTLFTAAPDPSAPLLSRN